MGISNFMKKEIERANRISKLMEPYREAERIMEPYREAERINEEFNKSLSVADEVARSMRLDIERYNYKLNFGLDNMAYKTLSLDFDKMQFYNQALKSINVDSLFGEIAIPNYNFQANTMAEHLSQSIANILMQNIIKTANFFNVPLSLSQSFQSHFSAINSWIQKYEMSSSKIDIIAKTAKEFELAMPQYSFGKLADILQDSLKSLNQYETIKLDVLANKVAEVYINKYTKDVQTPKSKNNTSLKYNIVKDIRDWISFSITIICFIITIYGLIDTKPNTTYKTTMEINNYYTISNNISPDLLNDLSYRIIVENNVMPRLKPNCSSRVTGHLNIGHVVMVLQKHKKWILVSWKDENGIECSGWIQNYKVTIFK